MASTGIYFSSKKVLCQLLRIQLILRSSNLFRVFQRETSRASYELRLHHEKLPVSGSVVFWNFTEIEAQTVLALIKGCETKPYAKEMVEEELERMEFQFHK